MMVPDSGLLFWATLYITHVWGIQISLYPTCLRIC